MNRQDIIKVAEKAGIVIEDRKWMNWVTTDKLVYFGMLLLAEKEQKQKNSKLVYVTGVDDE